jgi:hypothetical protein
MGRWIKGRPRSEATKAKISATLKGRPQPRPYVQSLKMWATRRANDNHRFAYGDKMITHHNDLCHGALRPDDTTKMSHREHSRLHCLIRCQVTGKAIGRS